MSTITRRHLLGQLVLGAAGAQASFAGAHQELVEAALRNSFTLKQAQPAAPDLRVALIVGHNRDAQGADGKFKTPTSEWRFWADRGAALQEVLELQGCEVKLYHRPPGKQYAQEIRECYQEAYEEMKPHALLEMHFNDGGRAEPRGTITLHGGSVLSGVLASACQTGMEEAFNQIDPVRQSLPWNRVLVRKHGRGAASLRACPAPTVLLEPAFAGSNPEEAELLDWCFQVMCERVAYQIRMAAAPLLAGS